MFFITKALTSSSKAESRHLLRVATAAAVGGQLRLSAAHSPLAASPAFTRKSPGWLAALPHPLPPNLQPSRPTVGFRPLGLKLLRACPALHELKVEP